MTLLRLLSLVLVLVISGCVTGDSDQAGTISGTVNNERSISLPEKTTLVIRLEEVSFGVTSSRIVAEEHIKSPGTFPMSYSIDYPLDTISEDKRYSITATIYAGNLLLLRSDIVHYVLTDGHSNTADLMVRTAVLEP